MDGLVVLDIEDTADVDADEGAGWSVSAGVERGRDANDAAEREGPSLEATSALRSKKRLYSYFARVEILQHTLNTPTSWRTYHEYIALIHYPSRPRRVEAAEDFVFRWDCKWNSI